jgi:hypothetical protein
MKQKRQSRRKRLREREREFVDQTCFLSWESAHARPALRGATRRWRSNLGTPTSEFSLAISLPSEAKHSRRCWGSFFPPTEKKHLLLVSKEFLGTKQTEWNQSWQSACDNNTYLYYCVFSQKKKNIYSQKKIVRPSVSTDWLEAPWWKNNNVSGHRRTSLERRWERNFTFH